MKRERDYTLDILRIAATFSVISVHFFLNNGFYYTAIAGKRMYIMVVIRTFFMICVPLFIMLTGYLMNTKKITTKYYQGISKTLCIYVLASIICIIYKKLAGITDYGIRSAFFAILDFSGANYSWYIEMYIGLFLLIPFLNLIFCHLDEKGRKTLVITLLFLTSVPTFTNIYNFYDVLWWINPAADNNYQKLLPFYWGNLWPITYYFIGCYLKEYPLNLTWKKASFLAALVTLISGTFSFYRSYNSQFIWGAWQGWNGLLNIILSTLIFHCLLQIKSVNKLPDALKNVLKVLSDITLGAYLVSYIFDQMFYKVLNSRVSEVADKLKYYIIVVPLVFICSMLLSFLLNLIYYILHRGIQKVKGQ